jgi:hypothetical protein
MSIDRKLDEILEVLLWIQYKVERDQRSAKPIDFLWVCSLSGVCEKEESMSILDKLIADGIIVPVTNLTTVPHLTSYGIDFIKSGGYSNQSGTANSSAA